MSRIPSHDLEEVYPALIWVWRRFHELSGPPTHLQTREFRSVVDAVQKLRAGLETGDALVGQDYFADPQLLGGYLLYQWVLHYLQGLALINEIPDKPKRVLEIASGPAPFAFAASRHGAHETYALDRNAKALQLGAEVCGRYGVTINTKQWLGPQEKLPVEGKFDLIIVAHCLEELFPSTKSGSDEAQLRCLKAWLKMLTPHGHLMVVDSSLQHTNQRVLKLRDSLVAEGVPIQAPCVWRGACPALQTTNSPCYAQRELDKPYLVKEIQRAAKINLNSLKMSYIIFRNPEAGWPQVPEYPLYRVISPPADAYQGKRYYLCGTDGKKRLESQLTQYPPESRAFEYLKRGELISFVDPLVRPHGFDIVAGTHVKVEAACNKSINYELEQSI